MAVDELTYPAANLNRQPSSGGAGGAAAVAPPLPRTRVFPFAVNVGIAGGRSSITTPRILGPAIVRGLHVTSNGGVTGNFGFGLGKAFTPLSEVSVAGTTPRPFTPLFEGLPQIGAPPTTGDHTSVEIDVQNPSPLMDDDSLGLIVDEPEFFLVVYAQGGTGAGRSIVGHVTVVEQVSRAALANFL